MLPYHCENCAHRRAAEIAEHERLIPLMQDKEVMKKVRALLLDNRVTEAISLVQSSIPDGARREPFRAEWRKFDAERKRSEALRKEREARAGPYERP